MHMGKASELGCPLAPVPPAPHTHSPPKPPRRASNLLASCSLHVNTACSARSACSVPPAPSLPPPTPSSPPKPPRRASNLLASCSLHVNTACSARSACSVPPASAPADEDSPSASDSRCMMSAIKCERSGRKCGKVWESVMRPHTLVPLHCSLRAESCLRQADTDIGQPQAVQSTAAAQAPVGNPSSAPPHFLHTFPHTSSHLAPWP